MADVDKLNERLQSFAKKLAKEEEEEKARKKEEEEEQQRLKQQQQQQQQEQRELEEEEEDVHPQHHIEERKRIPSPLQRRTLTERVRLLKLQPKFEVTETRDSYIIATYLPGMRDEDISIHRGVSGSARTLTIEGVRVPTPQEEQQIRQLIRKRTNGKSAERW